MGKEQIEKILKSTKVSMEIEGFRISRELEEKGRKLLTGELGMDEYLSDCRRKAQGFAHEI
jgi:hypothetical protein